MTVDPVLGKLIVSALVVSLIRIFNAINRIALFKGFKRFPEVYLVPKRPPNPKKVTVMVALHKEKEESIRVTARSIMNQEYPKELLEVFFVVEPDDYSTIEAAERVAQKMRELGYDARVVKSDGKLKYKAHALNCALKEASGEIIGVYDADDEVDPKQIAMAVALIEEGYHAVGSRVIRHRENVVGRFSNIETIVRHEAMLPFYRKVRKVTQFSGEGFFIRKDVLEAVGGFPEKLTEDSYLTVILFEKGYKVAHMRSYVKEIAPKSRKAFIKQRMRRALGRLQAAGRAITARMPITRRLAMFRLLAGTAIVVMAAIIASVFGLRYARNVLAESIEAASHYNPIIVGIIASIPPGAYLLTSLASYHLMVNSYFSGDYRRQRKLKALKYALALPLFRMFEGLIVLRAIIRRPKKRYKTERR